MNAATGWRSDKRMMPARRVRSASRSRGIGCALRFSGENMIASDNQHPLFRIMLK
jgi:hypothetical protein